MKGGRALVLRLDAESRIDHVWLDDIGLEASLGTPIWNVAAEGSETKLRRFVETIRRHGIAADWEIVVALRSEAVVLSFSGVLNDAAIVCIAAQSLTPLDDLLGELAAMQSDQTNELRLAAQRLAKFERSGKTSDHVLEEMTALNNQLMSAQRQLAKHEAQLSRLNREKDRLLGHVAHDLRNPLQSILGYSRLMRDGVVGPLTPEQTKCLDAIERASAHMVALVESLVDVAAMDAGVSLNLESFDLAAQVADDLDIHRIIAERKSITLEVGGLSSLYVRGDVAKVSQVVHNLVSNAIKFSPPHTRVTVDVAERGTEAVITICDHGVGIPKENLEHVFEPLFRGSGGTAGEKSTGLGLAIVRRIVEAHHGRVEVESEVGVGTTFRVALPLGGPRGSKPPAG